ncbi:hypothetical protein [Cellulosimicrobium sp. NPDC057127]|uniref:hypothetical protein n=1 Tax=Cellulosimicrobium sp. NPDC057127 TaxID=3346026 RepID=UPI003643C77B
MSGPAGRSDVPGHSVADDMSDVDAAAYIEAHHDEIRTEGGDVAAIEFESSEDVSLVVPVRIAKGDVETVAAAAKAAGVPLSTYMLAATLAAARSEPGVQQQQPPPASG